MKACINVLFESKNIIKKTWLLNKVVLAYFIESSNLTKDQEKVFFEAYGDDYEPKYLLIHRIIVNALIVLWINSHEINPFSDEIYNKRVEKYMQEYLSKYN